mgnify:CR=1 FL=1
MANFKLLKELVQPAKTKIVLLVLDGVGGLPRASDDQTELEAAFTPNLDRLAAEGCLGQHYRKQLRSLYRRISHIDGCHRRGLKWNDHAMAIQS